MQTVLSQPGEDREGDGGKEKNLLSPIKASWPLLALRETSAFTHQRCHEPALIPCACVCLCVCLRVLLCVRLGVPVCFCVCPCVWQRCVSEKSGPQIFFLLCFTGTKNSGNYYKMNAATVGL